MITNSEMHNVLLQLRVTSDNCGYLSQNNDTCVTPTIVAVRISRTKLVQGLGGEAVGFILVATAVIVAVAWRVWYEQMAC